MDLSLGTWNYLHCGCKWHRSTHSSSVNIEENGQFSPSVSSDRGRQLGRGRNMSCRAAGPTRHNIYLSRQPSYIFTGIHSKLGLFLLVFLLLCVPPATCERDARQHLRYRRQAVAAGGGPGGGNVESSTKAGQEGEPPTTVLQQQKHQQVSPGIEPGEAGEGAKGTGKEGGRQVPREVLPSPASGVNNPVLDSSRSDGGSTAHSGVIIVLTLVCVTLLVIVLVGLAAVLRYFVLQRRKKNTPRDGLWTEGASYSPANPRPPPRRHHSSRQATKNGSINRSTGHTLASHISTELYRAVYPYRPSDTTQLTLEPGCVVEVVEKTRGWWRGYVGQTEGWFPENYVERVYEGSGITLEDYTETMGETLTRHLSGQQNNTNTTVTKTTVTPTREELRHQGIDEVDFQAASSSSHRTTPKQDPSLRDPGDDNNGSLSRGKEVSLLQGRASSSPRESEVGEVEDAPASAEDFLLERPIASSPENDLLESIFNDLEKAWNKSEVSTPINKDYCKVGQIETNAPRLSLGESFEEQTIVKEVVPDETEQPNPEGIYEFNKYMRFQLEAEKEAELLGDSVIHSSKSSSPDEPGQRKKADAEDLYINCQEEREKAAEQGTEDLYINCAEERQAAEQMEDLYINCQEERKVAIREEDKAREDFEAVTRKLDKILMDEANSDSSPTEDNQSYRVLYSYSPQNTDELAITENEILHHVDSQDNNWIKVRNTSGGEGLVPCNYICPDDSLEEKHQFKFHMSPDTPESDEWDDNSDVEVDGDVTAIEYRAIYDYVPRHAGDLALSVGDRVAAISNTDDNGWWKGYCSGNEGWFPAAYVEMATESAPSTPAALTPAPFSAFSIDTDELPKDRDLLPSGHVADDSVQEEEDDQVPPPLPTCPPPTDEELEELERVQTMAQNPASNKESPSATTVPSVNLPQNPVSPLSNDAKRHTPEGEVKVANPSCQPHVNSISPAPAKPVPPELNITYVKHDAKKYNNREKSSGIKIGEIPPGGYGSNKNPSKKNGSVSGGSHNSSVDDSEGERHRFKLPKKFAKPKFVKIPKRILLKRVGSVGKRPAPPPPGVHSKVIPEISAPILQQASDPTRIAASQELRVSFREPVKSSPPHKNANQELPHQHKHKDTSHIVTPGILKNGNSALYESPHGGSYVDIMGNGPRDRNANNNRDLNQSMDADSLSDSLRNPSFCSNYRSSSDDGDISPDTSRSFSPESRTKTPPPRPRPISGLSNSVPASGSRSRVDSTGRQESVSFTTSPVDHNSSWALRHSNRFNHTISEDSSRPNGHTNSSPEAEFSIGPQPKKGRKYSRPSGAPPPRPKMPPPPRPPGPPPGRVGAHGDGVFIPNYSKKQTEKQEQQFIKLDGLDESHSNTEGGISCKGEGVISEIKSKDLSWEPPTQTKRMSHEINLDEEKRVPDDSRISFISTGSNGVINLNHDPTDPQQASHLTESSDFDEIDGPAFQVVSMTNHNSRLRAGPRDSFRKYKKDKTGGKKSSLIVDIPDLVHNADTNGMISDNKRKACTLPNGLSSAGSWPGSAPGETMNGGPNRVQQSKLAQRTLSLDRNHTPDSLLHGQFSSTDGSLSPTRRPAPPRPPPPSSSPDKSRRNSQRRNSKGDIPVKPPRKDKVRRSVEGYQAIERGELSFDEDAIIKDIGQQSNISTNASEPPKKSGEIVWI